MAQTENGVGVSYKLADGTMVWARRDTYAELSEDVKVIFGEDALARLEEQTHRAWGGNKPPNNVVPMNMPESVMTATEVAAALAEEQTYETCPRCGGVKDRWVEPGVSKKTGKPYPGFFGCSTPRCPGR